MFKSIYYFFSAYAFFFQLPIPDILSLEKQIKQNCAKPHLGRHGTFFFIADHQVLAESSIIAKDLCVFKLINGNCITQIKHVQTWGKQCTWVSRLLRILLEIDIVY